MRALCFLLILVSVAAGYDYEWYWINDFSGGLRTDISPTLLPKNTALQLNDAIIEGTSIRLRPGYSVWATSIDTSTDGSAPSIARPVRGLYEFYNSVTGEKQLIAMIHDEAWYKTDSDDSFQRMGMIVTGGQAILSDNDTIAYCTNSDWLTNILPEDGNDWVLYLYTDGGTYSYPVYRVLSNNHVKLDEANTDGSFVNITDYALIPTFDTTRNIDFSATAQTCFLADGTHPVRKWNGTELANGHYIIDSAVIASASYESWNDLETLIILLATPLAQSDDVIAEYASAHYAIAYDLLQSYPFSQQVAIMRSPIVYATSDTLVVFGDMIEQLALSKNQTIYVVPPMSEGWAFDVDTVYTGTADSIIQYDTLSARLSDSLLTQIGIDTLDAAEDSITIDLPISYGTLSEYQIVFSYVSDYDARIMVRKVATDQFRFVRPPTDNVPEQILQWVAIGQAADPDSADAATDGGDWLWQWGIDTMGTAAGTTRDTVTLSYTYNSVDDYTVITAPLHLNSSYHKPAYITSVDGNTFYYNSDGYKGYAYRWICIGDPNTPTEANSAEDSLLIQYAVDTLAAHATGTQTENIYFDEKYLSALHQIGIASVDSNTGPFQDTIEGRVAVAVLGKSWFELKRYANDVAQHITWISAGPYVRVVADSNHATVVYDQDVFIDDTIRNENLFTAPYLFKVIGGPTADEDWWANGLPCTFHMTTDDSLVLRVLAPTFDYDSNLITLPPPDSAEYVVLALEYYPPAFCTALRQNRMWFAGTETGPNSAWWSSLDGAADLMTKYHFDDVNTVDYEIIGAGDNDEIVQIAVNQQWLVAYKYHHVYVVANNDIPLDVYERARNYGLWGSAAFVSYLHNDFGVNLQGIFAFNGAEVSPHNQISAAINSFFVDSLNISNIDVARAEFYRDYLLFSVPTGSSTSNSETLVLDTRTGAWFTWSLAMASTLTRRAPGELDTLLWGSPDSATIFVMGGSDDAGSPISLTYQTPYLDFELPEWRKQIRKYQVTCQANSGCSLAVSIYADDLQTVEYADTIACNPLLGYASPQTITRDLPQSIESTLRYSLLVTSINADSLKIDRLGILYNKTQEVGAQ